MSNRTVKDNRKPSSANSLYNALELMIDNAIHQKINTSEMVMVVDVEPGGPGGAAGYVTVKPLVRQTDAREETHEPVELYKLPYTRMQCGGAAIVMDPQPGDIGMVNFTKRDSSGVKQEQAESVPPGSYRTFDRGNGVFMGTILNKAPETYVEMAPDEKRVTTRAPESAVVETKESTVNAGEKAVTNTKAFEANASQTASITAGMTASLFGGAQANVSAPQVGISGNLTVTGEGGGAGNSSIIGNVRIEGNLEVTGSLIVGGDVRVGGGLEAKKDVVAGGISLINHAHPGVQPGAGRTQPPV